MGVGREGCDGIGFGPSRTRHRPAQSEFHGWKFTVSEGCCVRKTQRANDGAPVRAERLVHRQESQGPSAAMLTCVVDKRAQ